MKKLQWIAWNIALNQDGELESFDYKLISEAEREFYNCALALVHFQELVEKYGALYVLRTRNCRPRDPKELVKFIIKNRT